MRERGQRHTGNHTATMSEKQSFPGHGLDGMFPTVYFYIYLKNTNFLEIFSKLVNFKDFFYFPVKISRFSQNYLFFKFLIQFSTNIEIEQDIYVFVSGLRDDVSYTGNFWNWLIFSIILRLNEIS